MKRIDLESKKYEFEAQKYKDEKTKRKIELENEKQNLILSSEEIKAKKIQNVKELFNILNEFDYDPELKEQLIANFLTKQDNLLLLIDKNKIKNVSLEKIN